MTTGLDRRLERIRSDDSQYRTTHEQQLARCEVEFDRRMYPEKVLNDHKKELLGWWRKRQLKIKKRKIPTPEAGRAHPLLSLKNPQLCKMAFWYFFRRSPKDMNRHVFFDKQMGLDWKKEFAALMAKRAWTETERERVAELVYRLTDNWDIPRVSESMVP